MIRLESVVDYLTTEPSILNTTFRTVDPYLCPPLRCSHISRFAIVWMCLRRFLECFITSAWFHAVRHHLPIFKQTFEHLPTLNDFATSSSETFTPSCLATLPYCSNIGLCGRNNVPKASKQSSRLRFMFGLGPILSFDLELRSLTTLFC